MEPNYVAVIDSHSEDDRRELREVLSEIRQNAGFKDMVFTAPAIKDMDGNKVCEEYCCRIAGWSSNALGQLIVHTTAGHSILVPVDSLCQD